MEKKDIERINELAKKKRTVGLSQAELDEQQRLYKQYIEEFRANTRATLENVYIEQEDGSYQKLRQKTSSLKN